MIFCFFFILFDVSYEDKVISLFYNKHRMERPLIPLSFIHENCNVTTFANTFINYTIFDDNFENPISEHFVNKSIRYTLNNEYVSSIYITDIKMNKTILDKGKVLVHEEDHIGFYADKGIGLKYKFNDESFSIVHMLYRNKLIDRKVFAFEPYANFGYLHFGGIPNNTHIHSKYKGYLNIEEDTDNWEGVFKGIIHNNISYNFSSPFIIHTGHFGFIYSNELFNLFINEIAKPLINKKECWIVKSNSDGDSVECFPNYIEKLGSISFIFNNMKISMPFASLFSESNLDEVESLIRSFPSKMKYNRTVLGIMFVKSFNYSLFDYDSNKVSFYSDKYHIEMLHMSHKTHFIYTCFVNVSLLCLINICILIIINLKL